MSVTKKRIYHLSYDIKADDDADYNYYKDNLVCLIKKTKPLKVYSPCASTLIIHYYEEDSPRLIKILTSKLDYDIYTFFISIVKSNKDGEFYYGENIDVLLNINFQQYYKNLKCI